MPTHMNRSWGRKQRSWESWTGTCCYTPSSNMWISFWIKALFSHRIFHLPKNPFHLRTMVNLLLTDHMPSTWEGTQSFSQIFAYRRKVLSIKISCWWPVLSWLFQGSTSNSPKFGHMRWSHSQVLTRGHSIRFSSTWRRDTSNASLTRSQSNRNRTSWGLKGRLNSLWIKGVRIVAQRNLNSNP